eukprot:TRINITY_DN2889_c0_g1_i1.p1 TRINITY_DN2889_c0_g1~~TRINITY_DN2889_c0_g1_i1.p1  ORF type:complete len:332 (+),score=99.78 TRINITY_DN2889_c0_g1_i1:35-1030(+)
MVLGFFSKKKGIKLAREQFKKKQSKMELAKLGYRLPFKFFGVDLYWKPKKLSNWMLVGFGSATLAFASLIYLNNTEDTRTWDQRITKHGKIEEIKPNFFKLTSSQWGMNDLRLMSIYRMNSGGLLIHGALAINEEEIKNLEKLGSPEIIIVPSLSYEVDSKVYKERYPEAKLVCPEPIKEKLQSHLPIDCSAEDIFNKGNSFNIKVHKPPLKQKYTEYIYEIPLGNGEKGLILNEMVLNVDGNIKRNFFFSFMNFFYNVAGDGVNPTISYGYKRVSHTSSVDLINFWIEFSQYISQHNKSQDDKITVATVSHSKEICGDLDIKFRSLIRQI